MKILCLYNNDCALDLFDWIAKEGHTVVVYKERLDVTWCKQEDFDLTVSYTYRYILTEEMLDALHDNVVNLHNSYLPWNRGADPNLWSIVTDSKRGVTLHYMDKQLDKGFIIAQKEIPYKDDDTLRTSYYELDEAAKEQFKECFKHYYEWSDIKFVSQEKGSYHSAEDGRWFKEQISTYDIKIKDFKTKINNSHNTNLGE